jgi:nitrite reductase/ring-hydroxylating ferredoxin subunit
MFDIRTGEVHNPPATEPLETFEAREVEGQIQVGA